MDEKTESILAGLRKTHGNDAINRFGDKPQRDVSCISTGSLPLDIALGGHGLPKGRIIEIFGPESSGKTTLCLHAIAEAQKQGLCAFIDAEHAFDPAWATKLGVDCDSLLFAQPMSGEEALDIAAKLVEAPDVKMVVIDSVAALVPLRELQGDIGDAHVGGQARMLGQAMRMITAKAAQNETILVFINQIREKIGVMFGSPETTPGGRALKFFASCRIDIRRIGGIKGPGETLVGNRVKCKIVKNKIAPPMQVAEVDLLFDRGIDPIRGVVDVAFSQKILSQAGSWIKLDGKTLAAGRDKLCQKLAAEPELLADIKARIHASFLSMEGRGSN